MKQKSQQLAPHLDHFLTGGATAVVAVGGWVCARRSRLLLKCQTTRCFSELGCGGLRTSATELGADAGRLRGSACTSTTAWLLSSRTLTSVVLGRCGEPGRLPGAGCGVSGSKWNRSDSCCSSLLTPADAGRNTGAGCGETGSSSGAGLSAAAGATLRATDRKILSVEGELLGGTTPRGLLGGESGRSAVASVFRTYDRLLSCTATSRLDGGSTVDKIGRCARGTAGGAGPASQRASPGKAPLAAAA